MSPKEPHAPTALRPGSGPQPGRPHTRRGGRTHRFCPRFWETQALSPVSTTHPFRWCSRYFVLSGAPSRSRAAERLGVRRHRRQRRAGSPGHRHCRALCPSGGLTGLRDRPMTPLPAPRRCPARLGPTQPRRTDADPAAPRPRARHSPTTCRAGPAEGRCSYSIAVVRTEQTGLVGDLAAQVSSPRESPFIFASLGTAKKNSNIVTPVLTMVPLQLKANLVITARVRRVGRHGNGGGGAASCAAAPPR